MSKQFKVGDLVVGCDLVYNTERNGLEGVVTACLGAQTRNCSGIAYRFGVWYTVHWADGHTTNVRSVNLKKKRPPRREIDTVVSWEDCAWSPMTVKLDEAIKRAKETA